MPYKGKTKIHKGHVVIVVEIDGQLWAVPSVPTVAMVFLRTAYPVEKERV